MTSNTPICRKCGARSGNDWTQCKNECPMVGSPHFKATTASKYGALKINLTQPQRRLLANLLDNASINRGFAINHQTKTVVRQVAVSLQRRGLIRFLDAETFELTPLGRDSAWLTSRSQPQA